MYKRSRIIYGLMVLVTILLGLASRRFSDVLPSWIGMYSGDVLWALMVFFIFGFIFVTWTTIKVGLMGVIFSFIIEISQLYQSPWISDIRKTRFGGLILGFGFLWSDIACYLIGIGIGALIEMFVIRSKAARNR